MMWPNLSRATRRCALALILLYLSCGGGQAGSEVAARSDGVSCADGEAEDHEKPQVVIITLRQMRNLRTMLGTLRQQ